MVSPVQRTRGPQSFSQAQAHLGWPSDVTEAQKALWREQWNASRAGSRKIIGRDLYKSIRCALGISDAFPLKNVSLGSELNDVTTLTITVSVTPDLLLAISQNLQNEQAES